MQTSNRVVQRCCSLMAIINRACNKEAEVRWMSPKPLILLSQLWALKVPARQRKCSYIKTRKQSLR